ncbi:MAG: hypothetical protein HRU12_14580 [Phaeodactylibacter sp.]|nr:hypothetical protein [Phaeodactylibacter sp.]
MIANWVHIMIVHLAVIGTPWLVYRTMVHRKEPLDSKRWKDTYSLLIALGAIAGIAYFTGPEAADWTKQVLDTYNQDLVEDHALWGRIAFVIQVVTALLGVMGWATILQEEKPDKRVSIIVIVLLILNTLVMVYTAHLGGLIRRVDLM